MWAPCARPRGMWATAWPPPSAGGAICWCWSWAPAPAHHQEPARADAGRWAADICGERPELVRHSRQRMRGVDVRQHDALSLSTIERREGRHFDAILSSLPMTNWNADAQRQFMSQLLCNLRPGGQFIFVTYVASGMGAAGFCCRPCNPAALRAYAALPSSGATCRRPWSMTAARIPWRQSAVYGFLVPHLLLAAALQGRAVPGLCLSAAASAFASAAGGIGLSGADCAGAGTAPSARRAAGDDGGDGR